MNIVKLFPPFMAETMVAPASAGASPALYVSPRTAEKIQPKLTGTRLSTEPSTPISPASSPNSPFTDRAHGTVSPNHRTRRSAKAARFGSGTSHCPEIQRRRTRTTQDTMGRTALKQAKNPMASLMPPRTPRSAYDPRKEQWTGKSL